MKNPHFCPLGVQEKNKFSLCRCSNPFCTCSTHDPFCLGHIFNLFSSLYSLAFSELLRLIICNRTSKLRYGHILSSSVYSFPWVWLWHWGIRLDGQVFRCWYKETVSKGVAMRHTNKREACRVMIKRISKQSKSVSLLYIWTQFKNFIICTHLIFSLFLHLLTRFTPTVSPAAKTSIGHY